MAKLKYSDIIDEIRATTDFLRDKADTYASPCGVYESMLATLAADLPVHGQKELLQTLRAIRSFEHFGVKE